MKFHKRRLEFLQALFNILNEDLHLHAVFSALWIYK